MTHVEISPIDEIASAAGRKWTETATNFGLPQEIIDQTGPLFSSMNVREVAVPRSYQIDKKAPETPFKTLQICAIKEVDVTKLFGDKNTRDLIFSSPDLIRGKCLLPQAIAATMFPQETINGPLALQDSLINQRGAIFIERVGLAERVLGSEGKSLDFFVNSVTRPFIDFFRKGHKRNAYSSEEFLAVSGSVSTTILALQAAIAPETLFPAFSEVMGTPNINAISALFIIGGLLAPCVLLKPTYLKDPALIRTHSSGETWRMGICLPTNQEFPKK